MACIANAVGPTRTTMLEPPSLR